MENTVYGGISPVLITSKVGTLFIKVIVDDTIKLFDMESIYIGVI